MESLAGETWFSGMLRNRSGIFAVFFIALICEAALMAGRRLELFRIFFGAVIFMGIVSFVILIRWDLQWYVLTAFSAQALTALFTRKKRGRVLLTLVLAAFGAYFMWQGETGRICAAGLVFLVLLSLVELSGGDINIQIPYCLILSLILLFVPVSEKPFDWTFVTRFISFAEKTLDETMNNISYYLGNLGPEAGGSGGYSGLGRIGSGVSKSTRQELEVSGTFRGAAYLSGVSYKKRQKGSWTKRAGSELAYNGWFIQFLNLLYQNGVSKETARGFCEMESIRIEYRYLKTADVIHPVNTVLIEKKARDDMTGDKGDYRFLTKKGKGNEYRLNYIALNTADPLLEEIIAKGSKGRMASYEEIDGFCGMLCPFELSHFISREDYEEYLKGYREELDDPELLNAEGSTERMRELAGKLTSDKKDDLSKARAIESYLRQYSYNRMADHSKDKDPVDGFLFEKQEGYCVHFASAMVELLRLAGIRARYSEGYAITFDKEKGKNVTEVFSSSAHAWPEAYIEGIGWTVFEPTPVHPVLGSLGWESREVKQTDPGDLAKRYGQNTVSPPQPESEPAGEAEKGFFERYGEVIRYSLYALLLLLLYFIVVFAARIIVTRLVYIKQDNPGKLMMNVSAIKKLIEKNYSGDWDNAPLRDYEAVLEGDLKRDARDVFEEYYRLRFAPSAESGREGYDEGRAEALRIRSEELKEALKKSARQPEQAMLLRL